MRTGAEVPLPLRLCSTAPPVSANVVGCARLPAAGARLSAGVARQEDTEVRLLSHPRWLPHGKGLATVHQAPSVDSTVASRAATGLGSDVGALCVSSSNCGMYASRGFGS